MEKRSAAIASMFIFIAVMVIQVGYAASKVKAGDLFGYLETAFRQLCVNSG